MEGLEDWRGIEFHSVCPGFDRGAARSRVARSNASRKPAAGRHEYRITVVRIGTAGPAADDP
ncbi:hypothetical protein [Burkholderia cenocepacia]|uniref:hypothetical protein n=1 Tax=Burkholderia cenocepacia TaxID=95486 RepID=UPI002AB00A97|nr:hypothetical protein [Burkholderia cenocepacia]